ncbi:ABC transporter substrate-binding protein [Paenibacillus sp. FJAT-26967]|uniref:ABC transporter substrate-binding protein n=1 Tax=Paenibacillus sp. FJAT-26967 TaxID=1729690 RepID=UPI000838623A|nr:extracellular solute-binding protein [Paenibacillus sp. FJAT-26967]
MRSILSRSTALGLAAVVTASMLLTACGGDKETAADKPLSSAEVYENGLPKDQQVTLKYGFFQGGLGREYMDYAIKTFTEKYPNVKIDMTASPDIANILSTKMSAGKDDDMFDLFNREPSGGIVALAKAGKLEPLDDLWERKLPDLPDKTVKDSLMDGFFESANRVDGKTYEISTSGSFGGLFFNKKLFEKNGWNQNPKTWGEFNSLLADIKSDGVIPVTFPGVYPNYFDWAFGTSKLFELADAKGTFDAFNKNYQNYTLPEYLSPESIERWNRIYELGKKGYFPEGLPALTHTQSQMQVIQGEAAMVSTGSHVENEMKKSAPADFEWGYMAVPFVEKSDQTIWVRSGTTNGNFIWAGKPDLNKKWAREFILWQMTLDVQQFTAEKAGALPLRKDLVENPERAEKLQSSARAVLKYIKENKARAYKASRSVSISDPSYKQATKLIDEATTKIFLGKQDPLPVLQQAEELLKKSLDKMKK